MHWLRTKTAAIVGGCIALVGLQGYGWMSMRKAVNERISSAERQFQSARAEDDARIPQLVSDAVTQQMGNKALELKQFQALAEQVKQDNTQTAQRLRRELAAKASTQSVKKFQDDATEKLGAVSGEVQSVRTDLKDLSTQIAHNGDELAELRRRGERDYVEFDVNKSKDFAHIADVLVQVKKTDVKRQKFDVLIQVDDNRIAKTDRTANEPVAFLVGPDRLRYELVVNYVDKNRIRGYLSRPKDKTLAAEGPARRRLQ
jgi:oligoendopeptidase F